MPWRCPAPPLLRSEIRASSPHPVSPMSYYGDCLYSVTWSAELTKAWAHAWYRVSRGSWGDQCGPPLSLSFHMLWCPPFLPMMHLAGDLDSSCWVMLTLRMLMQRGPLLRQRVMRYSLDDAPGVGIITFKKTFNLTVCADSNGLRAASRQGT